MEKMSLQLQKNIEEKDAGSILLFFPPLFAHAAAALMSVIDAQQRAKSHLERLEGCQEELRKRDAEVRCVFNIEIVEDWDFVWFQIEKHSPRF